MKLHILSDLHLEFGEVEIPHVEADAMVLAGDIHRGLRGLQWVCDRFPHIPKLYVLGNHEFYKSATPKLNRKAQEFADGEPTLFVLDRSSTTIDGVRFLGATLWSDFGLYGPAQLGMREAGGRMNDFRLIRVDPSYRRLRPGDVAAWHVADRRFLESEVTEDARETVIVTHHAPSARSVDPRHGDDPVNAAYASNLDGLVEASGAALWIHGHTHHAVDYHIGSTRVLSNPRGYEDDPVPEFQPELVVEISRSESPNTP